LKLPDQLSPIPFQKAIFDGLNVSIVPGLKQPIESAYLFLEKGDHVKEDEIVAEIETDKVRTIFLASS
jgi:hypothetical protein